MSLGGEARPQGGYLGVQAAQISRVFEDIIGACGLLRVGDLMREADAGIGFSGGVRGFGCADARGVAGDFELVGRGDDDDAVNATAPVGQHGFAFAAGAGVALHFKNQCRLDHRDGGGIAGKDRIHPQALGGDYGGMDDGVQLVQPSAPEGQFGQARPIQAALASAASFAVGAAMPLAVTAAAPNAGLIPLVAGASLLFLALLGGLAARAGGAGVAPGAIRVTFWGALAMAVTAGVGALVGTATGV